MTHRCTHRRTALARPARGATLLVGMILLLLLSAVALTALKAIKTEERMAGNLQDRNLAFQAAEAALREAEDFLSQPSLGAFGATHGLYRFDDADIPSAYEFTAARVDPATGRLDPTTANARVYPRDLAGIARPPLYIVEQMETGVEQGASLVIGARYGADVRASYRITAIGYGGSPTTRVVLQSSYRR